VGQDVIAFEDGRDHLALNDCGVLVVEIERGLRQWLADHELMERDEVLLVVMNSSILLHFLFNRIVLRLCPLLE